MLYCTVLYCTVFYCVLPGQKYAMVLLLEDTDCWLPRGDRLVARVGPRLGARVG